MNELRDTVWYSSLNPTTPKSFWGNTARLNNNPLGSRAIPHKEIDPWTTAPRRSETIKLQKSPRPQDRPWNERKEYFNCYAFATSGPEGPPRENLPMIPGVIGGKAISNFSPKELRDSLIRRDGLIPATSPSPNDLPPAMKGYYLVAAVVDNRPSIDRKDYHFYKQDKDGGWTHKPKNYEVSRVDASGNIIKNPLLADRDYRKVLRGDFYFDRNYTDFVGFFYAPNEGLSSK